MYAHQGLSQWLAFAHIFHMLFESRVNILQNINYHVNYISATISRGYAAIIALKTGTVLLDSMVELNILLILKDFVDSNKRNESDRTEILFLHILDVHI
jgi:hypothetical protein